MGNGLSSLLSGIGYVDYTTEILNDSLVAEGVDPEMMAKVAQYMLEAIWDQVTGMETVTPARKNSMQRSRRSSASSKPTPTIPATACSDGRDLGVQGGSCNRQFCRDSHYTRERRQHPC